MKQYELKKLFHREIDPEDPALQKMANDILKVTQEEVLENLKPSYQLSDLPVVLGISRLRYERWVTHNDFWRKWHVAFCSIVASMAERNIVKIALQPAHKKSFEASKEVIKMYDPERSGDYQLEKLKHELKNQGESQILFDLKEALKETYYAEYDAFPLWCRNCLSVQTKTGKFIRFKLNEPQQVLWQAVHDLIKRKLPVRILILKARQEGISTFIIALGLYFICKNPHTKGLLLAHDKTSSIELFDKIDVFYNTWTDKYRIIRPERARSSETLIELNNQQGTGHNSKFLVSNAKQAEKRSQTYQFIHLSERAFYPLRVIEDLDVSLFQSILSAPETFIFEETTANGVGEPFYERWQQAKQGEIDYVPVFIPWYQLSEYSKPFISNQQKIQFIESLDKNPRYNSPDDLSETEQMKRYNLTYEQLHWRRYTIDNQLKGRIKKFNQEYPHCDEVAFINSDVCFFDTFVITRLEKKYLRDTGKRYTLEMLFEDQVREENIKNVKIKEDVAGLWYIYRVPEKGRKIRICVDCAEGLDPDILVKDTKHDYDYTVIDVYDEEAREQCMVWRGYAKPSYAAKIVRAVNWLLGAYDNVIVVVERNNHGHALINELRRHEDEINLYVEKRGDMVDKKGQLERAKYGFFSSGKSKAALIDSLDIALCNSDNPDRCIILHYPETYKELKTFKRKTNGKLEGEPHDDTVITAALFTKTTENVNQFVETMFDEEVTEAEQTIIDVVLDSNNDEEDYI